MKHLKSSDMLGRVEAKKAKSKSVDRKRDSKCSGKGGASVTSGRKARSKNVDAGYSAGAGTAA
jgi:hypothetical protein